MRTTKWLIVLIVVLVVSALPSYSQTLPNLRWLESQQDKALWGKIKRAFQDELSLNPSDATPDTFKYKYLKAVGLMHGSALVMIGYREKEHLKHSEERYEYFRAFNYSLSSGATSKIETLPKRDSPYMWQWKMIKLARFEPAAPDVVFTYLTCSECEPERMLSTFRYDPAARLWEFRQWGSGKPLWWTAPDGIVVWQDISVGNDTASYDCLWGVMDLDGDGFDDLAARCKEVLEPAKNKRKVNDSTILYSLKTGHFTGAMVTDREQRTRIWNELCSSNSQNKLCKEPGITKPRKVEPAPR